MLETQYEISKNNLQKSQLDSINCDKQVAAAKMQLEAAKINERLYNLAEEAKKNKPK